MTIKLTKLGERNSYLIDETIGRRTSTPSAVAHELVLQRSGVSQPGAAVLLERYIPDVGADGHPVIGLRDKPYLVPQSGAAEPPRRATPGDVDGASDATALTISRKSGPT